MYRKLVELKVNEIVAEFKKREDISCVFGDAVICYSDANDPLYERFHEEGLSRKPKRTYRAGNTVITHYVPVIEKPESMLRAHFESIWLAMELNKGIRSLFREYGRLTSNSSSLVEWNDEVMHYDWDDRLVAYVAGLGDIGPAGSLKVPGSYAGRASSILLDYKLSQPKEYEDLDKEVETYLRKAGYAPDAGIKAECPGGAITENGIDRKACQEYCRGINPSTPCPEVCGKCFNM